jgi:hypothetical protein
MRGSFLLLLNGLGRRVTSLKVGTEDGYSKGCVFGTYDGRGFGFVVGDVEGYVLGEDDHGTIVLYLPSFGFLVLFVSGLGLLVGP